jgi:hypothetical protein
LWQLNIVIGLDDGTWIMSCIWCHAWDIFMEKQPGSWQNANETILALWVKKHWLSCLCPRLSIFLVIITHDVLNVSGSQGNSGRNWGNLLVSLSKGLLRHSMNSYIKKEVSDNTLN